MNIISQATFVLVGLCVFNYTINALLLFITCLFITHSRGRITTNAFKMFLFDQIITTPLTTILDLPFALLHLNLYSKLTHNLSPVLTSLVTLFVYLMFIETSSYWLHRYQHRMRGTILYRAHLQHHQNCKPTVLDAFDGHPIDNFVRMLPVHIFPFLITTNVYLYIFMYLLLITWNILIHDGIRLDFHNLIQDTQQHNWHHSHTSYNYGLFTTIWDRIMGTDFRKKLY